MKSFPIVGIRLLNTVLAVCFTVALASCAAEKEHALPPEIRAFCTNKASQARNLAEQLQLQPSRDVWAFFDAAEAGQISKAFRVWGSLRQRSGQYEGTRADDAVRSPVWQAVLEVELALEAFTECEPKYALAFGQGILKSLPPGSVYFGGTDPGRGLVTALSKSHAKADPCFILTQNALADGTYLHYLRLMYGARLYMPSQEDSQKAFSEYLADAQQRLKANKLKPGEDVKVVDNRVQVSGQVAVMAINARLAKVIFDKNPDREFFIEESFPLDWMYPHLSPHGLILKVNREPLSTLTDAQIEQDRTFWDAQVRQTLGDWLKGDTTITELCRFTERVYQRRDLEGFSGDSRYVTNAYACKMYSKLRSSMAGVYAWRAAQKVEPDEQKRLQRAAEHACRQAFALCPYSPEALFRFVTLLTQQQRVAEALQLARAAEPLVEQKEPVRNLIRELERMQKPVTP